MVGSATFTIEPSTTSRNVTAHSSASVTLPRTVARTDLAERGVTGHRVADVHQGRAQPAEPGLPLGRRPGAGRVVGGHTVGENVLAHDLWSCSVSGARP